jgi:hypothetical protein
LLIDGVLQLPQWLDFKSQIRYKSGIRMIFRPLI